MTLRRRPTPAALLLLAACAQPEVPRIAPAPPPPVIVPVDQPAPEPTIRRIVERCPTRADLARLRAARPKPLRDQKMPANPAERVATVTAQLGLYEATGGWADQVEAALRRCAAQD